MTGLLTTCGAQFRDWTSSYRLFSHDRLPVAAIFSVVRRAVLAELPPQAPVCAVLDDSLLRRSGLRIPGVAWRRDPLGPHFQTNFVRAQRFLQTSLALPASDGSARLLPVAFRHAPTPPQPSKKATATELQPYRAQVRAARLSQRASEQIRDLRADLDADASPVARRLLVAFDGGYTNQTVLRHLPPTPRPLAASAKMPACCFGLILKPRKRAVAVSLTGFPHPLPNRSAPTILPGRPLPSPPTAPPIPCASNAAPA